MKAALLTQDGFVVKDLPVPSCGPGQILVKTAVCGICEGDVFTYKSRRTKTADSSDHLLGHEGNGTVCKIGDGVRGFEVGDRVACLGGAYADYFVTTPELLTKIPDGLSFEQALGEPVACYVHAARRFGIQRGDKVAVLGCGFMGLGCLQMAQLAEPHELWAFDPIDWRRKAALALGASRADDPADFKSNVEPLTDAFDVVIEATGAQEAIELATTMVKQHGKIIIVGAHYSNGGRRDVNMSEWNFKAIDVINGHVRRDDEKNAAMSTGLELIERNTLKIQEMETIYSRDQAQQAFDDLTARKPGLLKAVLKFSDA